MDGKTRETFLCLIIPKIRYTSTLEVNRIVTKDSNMEDLQLYNCSECGKELYASGNFEVVCLDCICKYWEEKIKGE